MHNFQSWIAVNAPQYTMLSDWNFDLGEQGVSIVPALIRLLTESY